MIAEQIRECIPPEVEDWGWTAADGLDIKRHRRLPEGVQTVLVFLWSHWVEEDGPRNVARYAVAQDYHMILGAQLERICEQLRTVFPQETFVWFCDASPVPEVQAAQAAGLGVRGKNNLLLHRRLGTRFHIGEIVTTLSLPKQTHLMENLCKECNLCERVCPTGALGEAGFQRERCQSFLTQKKGALDERAARVIGKTGIVWGCDLCADVCPRNRAPIAAKLTEFYENRVPVVTAQALPELCKTHPYGWRGVEVMERNLRALEQSAKERDAT